MSVIARGRITIVNLNDGAKGTGISSTVRQYYLSTSETSLIGGSWGTSMPTPVTKTNSIWQRDVITYSDGKTDYTTAVCISSMVASYSQYIVDDELTSIAKSQNQSTISGLISDIQSRITQNSNAIATKVAITDYNSNNTAIEKHFSTIEQTASGISTRVTTAQSTADTIQADLNKYKSVVASTYSTITQTSDSINTAVSSTKAYADNAVNNVQIGGTNLILYSEVNNFNSDSFIYDSTNHIWTINVPTTANQSWGAGFYFSAGSRTAINSGEYLTYSCEVYSDVAFVLNHDVNNAANDGNSWGGNDNDDRSSEIKSGFGTSLSAGIWHKVWFTIKARADKSVGIQNANSNIGSIPQSSAYVIKIKHVKIEKGTKATDWSPAPEDVTTAINTAKDNAVSQAATNASQLYVTQSTYKSYVQQTDTAISAKVSQSDFNALGSRVSSAESALSVNTKAIATKVSQTDYDKNNTSIDKHFSTIEQTASGISTKVGTAQSTADTVQTDLTNYKSTVASTYSTIKQTNDSITVAISSTKTYADNSASTAQSNAVKAAATDATSKANSAYNKAVSYTDSKITVTEGKITATVNTAISNVQVGGRNYAIGTSDLTTWMIESSSIRVTVSDGYTQILNPSNAGHYGIYQDISVQSNTQYTISFDYISSGGGYALGGTSSNQFWGLSGYIDLTGSGRVNTTYTTNSNQTYIRVYLWGNNANSYLKVKTKSLKLEKGNKATDWSSAPEDIDATISSKVSQSVYDANNVLIANKFTEIKQTADSISLKVNSDGFVNSYPLAVYGEVTKGTYYTFGIDSGEYAAVCSMLTGLLVGRKYVAKITLKNIDCVSGATLDTYLSASVPTLSSYNDVEDYQVTDYNDWGDIYIEFTATASTMYLGFITGTDGWTNNTGGYCHIDIHNISLFYDNVKNRLLSVGIDIDSNKITETANTLLIRDSYGNVNTIFETVGGKPVLKTSYLQTGNLDVSGTFSERYSFVNRGTLNIINFSTLNNIAVNRGIDETPAIIVLPMYTAYAGGNLNTAAYQKGGTNISIQNSYNANMKNWKDAASLLNGTGKASLRYQLAASSVIIVSDPRIIAHNNYTGSVPTIYPNGSGNANDSVEYRKGRMFCNGKSARIAMILPGQTLRLQSGIETYNGTSYLVWYVVNASEYTSINKGLQIVGANSMFGSANSGVLSFYASNTYSNWGEDGTHDTDFLIAPKELDANIGGSTHAGEDPSIVLDCSDNTSPLFYVTER